MESTPDSAADPATLFTEAVSIMARLRGPGGCPWDREQSFTSIQKYTLEEAYEVFDAIERGHWQDLCEELGDLLLQVLFYSQMAAEPGYFTIGDVILGLNRKLIRRHPHVFGEEAAAAAGNGAASGMPIAGIDAAQVLRNWEAIKGAEKEERREGVSSLDTIPRALPALGEACKLGSRASQSGFDWPDVEGLFAKLDEEIAELRQAIGTDGVGSRSLPVQKAVIAEMGDVLFTAANLARRLEADPEAALRRANAKFRRRFRAMEAATSGPLQTLSAAQLDSLWRQVKQGENPLATETP